VPCKDSRHIPFMVATPFGWTHRASFTWNKAAASLHLAQMLLLTFKAFSHLPPPHVLTWFLVCGVARGSHHPSEVSLRHWTSMISHPNIPSTARRLGDWVVPRWVPWLQALLGVLSLDHYSPILGRSFLIPSLGSSTWGQWRFVVRWTWLRRCVTLGKLICCSLSSIPTLTANGCHGGGMNMVHVHTTCPGPTGEAVEKWLVLLGCSPFFRALGSVKETPCLWKH
jgi:hypothetical protein